MRFVPISLLALLPMLGGCVSVQAQLPENLVRQLARQDGVEISGVCSFSGQSYSEGAIACMEGQRLTCDAEGRWVAGGDC